MRPRPLRRLNEQVATPRSPSVFGSLTASAFIADLMAGSDSLDIVTIGDSNGGNNDYGYTLGLDRVFAQYFGLNMYATPLFSAGNRFIGSTSGNTAILTDNLAGNGNALRTADTDNTAGSTGTGSVRQMGVFTDSGDIDALKNHLVSPSTYPTYWSTQVNVGASMIQPGRWMHLPSCIATGLTYGGTGTTNAVRFLNARAPLLYGTADFQYRVVHGTWASGSTSNGKFKLRASTGGGTTYAIDSGFRDTITGSLGYATATLPISGINNFGSGNDLYGTWDGGASPSSNLVTGPFAALWMSMVRMSRLGYSVTSYTTSSGATTAQIADIVEGSDKMLDAFLKELRERQIAAGGSGRVLMFINSGVNGAETASTWTTAADRLVSRIMSRWLGTGGAQSQLAVVFSVTHPVTSTYSGSGSAWFTARTAVASAAQSWARSNSANNCTYVEINNMFSATKLFYGMQPDNTLRSTTLYANNTTDQIHLSTSFSTWNNGYDIVSAGIVASLLAQ
jgi:hypothetical protein